MIGPPTASDLVSIVVPVRNEARHVADLLDSLVVQEPPVEIIVVDAGSQDRTREIVGDYARKYGPVRLLVSSGTPAQLRNIGLRQAGGRVVAFIDGDCIANPFWIREMRTALRDADVVAGRTVQIGYRPFASLGRVELLVRGRDLTVPSCNLAYRRELLEQLGGFDSWFRTAEDIDLNLRAVQSGAKVTDAAQAIVYHRTRDTVSGFLSQALWNGFGRKQLALKHGRLWRHYAVGRVLAAHLSFWGLVRLAVGALGYAVCSVTMTGPPRPSQPAPQGNRGAGEPPGGVE